MSSILEHSAVFRRLTRDPIRDEKEETPNKKSDGEDNE